MSAGRPRGLPVEQRRRVAFGGSSTQSGVGAAPIHSPLGGSGRGVASGLPGSSLRCDLGGPSLEITSG
jgi:hypothetical protein